MPGLGHYSSILKVAITVEGVFSLLVPTGIRIYVKCYGFVVSLVVFRLFPPVFFVFFVFFEQILCQPRECSVQSFLLKPQQNHL